jgi:ribosome-associated toxin RatA of RatAB toxin-antitoxin module
MPPDAAQEVVVEIAATPAQCFEVLLDFERYPEWSSAVTGARIVARDAQGVGRIVEFLIDAKVKTIRYVLEYAYKKPSQLTWKSIDGDVQSIEGAYRLRKLGADRTAAACRQEIKLGFWLPGPLRKLAERTALTQSVTEFRDEVERRLAAAAAPPSGRRGRKA